MNLDKLRDARDEARKGRAELAAKLDELRAELADVSNQEKFLLDLETSLERAIGVSQHGVFKLHITHPDSDHGRSEEERPYWEIAKELLEEKNEPMTVPQMTLALTSRGYKVPGDGLRVAMIRRPDVFSKAGYGQYRLASWPKAETDVEVEDDQELTPEEAFGQPLTPDTPYRSHVLAEDNHA